MVVSRVTCHCVSHLVSHKSLRSIHYTLYRMQEGLTITTGTGGSTLHLSAFHQSEPSAGASGGTQAAAFNRRLAGGWRLEAGGCTNRCWPELQITLHTYTNPMFTCSGVFHFICR